MRLLITGASGFIGREVLKKTSMKSTWRVRCAVRSPLSDTLSIVEQTAVGDLSPEMDWTEALKDMDVVVHLAARVHVMKDASKNPLSEFRRVNVDGTLRLARQAAGAGIKRFIFLSSIKVNGEATIPAHPFTAESLEAPIDAYGLSKLEAEMGLKRIGSETGMQITIIRPPLVYGPGVKANFYSMMNWLSLGLPLPLGAIPNRRSLVALDNLVDLIMTCLDHPRAANQVFLVSDGEDLSTTDLLRRTAAALGRTARLIPVPISAVRMAARLTGRANFARRLCDSLQIDISKTEKLLAWRPSVRVDEALKKTAAKFLADRWFKK